MKVGVFGGTFDPIHVGHLIGAEHARVQLGLDHVLFLPTGQPWLKYDAWVSAYAGSPIVTVKYRLKNTARPASGDAVHGCYYYGAQ